jgi:surfactin synthase thioesterase subunit
MGNGVPPHDAQRELEQRALRNVRSLVDNLEKGERRDARRNLRLAAWLLVGIAIGAAVAYAVLRVERGPVSSGEIRMNAPPGNGR